MPAVLNGTPVPQSYATWLPGMVPGFLRQPLGRAFFTACGQALDSHIARTQAGVLERFPGTATADALPVLGADRQMPQGPNEPNATFQARLEQAFQAYSQSGSRPGLLDFGLQPAGYPTATIYRNRDWISSSFTGSGAGTVRAQGSARLAHTIAITCNGSGGVVSTVTVTVDSMAAVTLPFNGGVVAVTPVTGTTGQIVLTFGNVPGMLPGDTFSGSYTPSPPDGSTAKWARFWVVLAGTGFTAGQKWGDGVWADGSGNWPIGPPPETWGSSATSSDIAFVRQVINQWKPQRSVCMGVFVVLPVTPSGSPVANTSLMVDPIPTTRWLEESATFGGAAVAFWRFAGPIQTTP